MSYIKKQACSRCLMDTSDPGITFNHKGECNLCTEFLQRRAQHNYQGIESDTKFKNLITQIKRSGVGKEYDCVVGLSGGVDSSYSAYICKKNGLRVLAVHIDNGWNSEEAVLNIKNIAQKLEIDYESYVLDWEEFKDLQLSFLRASVPEAETPTDVALLGGVHKIANKYNIKYVISGGNLTTEGILPKFWHYNAKDEKYLKYIQKKFGTKTIYHIPLFGAFKEFYYKIFRHIQVIYILNYIPFNKNEAIQTLKSEIGWKEYGGKHQESVYTSFIQSYYLYIKHGIDYRKATLSSQICTGQITREDALKQIESLPYNEEKVNREKHYIAKKLGIAEKEMDDIINSDPKWYTDYPNNEKVLGFVYDMYRKIFKKEKLANF